MQTLALSAVAFVRSDPDLIFRQLHDPAVLVSCVPGATLTAVTGPDSFEARIGLGLGPLRSDYRGKGRITSSNPRSRKASLELSFDPAGNLAHVLIRMAMAVARRESGAVIRMTFDVVMPEPTWLLAQAWVEPIACDLIDRTTTRMTRQLEAQVAPMPPAA